MPNFVYLARDQSGAMKSGHLEAVDEDEVVGILQHRGLYVTQLSRSNGAAHNTLTQQPVQRRLLGRVTVDDKVLFCQQLATLIEAGLPLLKSLEIVSSQVESRPLLLAVEQIRQDVEAGRALHQAMAQHPKLFTSFWVNLVESGEASGNLAASLDQLAGYLESARTLQRKAMTALTYPAFLMIACVVVMLVFAIKIIPIFSTIFKSLGSNLPLMTRVIVGISDVIRHYFVLVLAGFVLAWHLLRRYLQTESGRWLLDRLVLKIPVFQKLFQQFQLAQFSRGLSTLLNSGVPILFSLEIMSHSASNKVYGQAIADVREYVREGQPMAEPMSRIPLFPPMMVQMIQVGEEIGQLGKMLDKVASYYEERVSTFIERLTVLFEPIAIAVMAVLVGTIVISMYLPIFGLATGVRVH